MVEYFSEKSVSILYSYNLLVLFFFLRRFASGNILLAQYADRAANREKNLPCSTEKGNIALGQIINRKMNDSGGKGSSIK